MEKPTDQETTVIKKKRACYSYREEEMPHHADDATPRKATQRSTRLGQEAERAGGRRGQSLYSPSGTRNGRGRVNRLRIG